MDTQQQAELAALVGAYCQRDGFTDTTIPSLRYYRMQVRRGQMPVVYNSSLCLVVQGRKEAMLESEMYRYTESQHLVVSVDIPAVGQVMQASPDRPYLCMQLNLDPRLLSELIVQLNWKDIDGNATHRGLFVGTTTAELADCALRLVRLLDKPNDVPFLAPVVLREIHYRLLSGEHGRRIASTVLPDSNMQRISLVFRMLKRTLPSPFASKRWPKPRE
jgi:hypothetical protein